MQHARISVKHLTTVLMLAAKLIQSGSVVNTGIWTKPRQPGMANSPTAGSCRAAPLQSLLKPLLQAWVPWERGWQLPDHGDMETARAAVLPGKNGWRPEPEPPALGSCCVRSPMGMSQDLVAQQPHSPATSSLGQGALTRPAA